MVIRGLGRWLVGWLDHWGGCRGLVGRLSRRLVTWLSGGLVARLARGLVGWLGRVGGLVRRVEGLGGLLVGCLVL